MVHVTKSLKAKRPQKDAAASVEEQRTPPGAALAPSVVGLAGPGEASDPSASPPAAEHPGKPADEVAGKTGDEAPGLSAVDEALLVELAELWRAHQRQDLETRHRTGKLLNDHYGPPGKAQPRGQAVLKAAGERLGLTQSDLSRMRNFAARFADVEDLLRQHPEATTWTRVKELLARLNDPAPTAAPAAPPPDSAAPVVPAPETPAEPPPESPPGGGQSSPGEAAPVTPRKGSRSFQEVERSLKGLAAQLGEVAADLDGGRREALVTAFRELSAAAEAALNIRVQIEAA